ncbi:imelysin family protein [Roseomonas sp. E05]|uniref:imelysin family protein n=1 Tax=Roseomonas sp. E05 TaxID=3046310 RepID=UPI0024BB8C77|nr:imelysin family protein [Roseomonas sp. E05]MDJ0389352.1 imelysin family protein [Roseomonas sp. E05]
MRVSRRAVLALPAALLLGPRSAGAAPDEEGYRTLNRAVVEQVLLPAYRRFAEATANFAAQLDTLARNPAEAAPWQAARQGFGQTVLAWEGVQPVRFGPADLFSRHARIQTWPDPQDSIGHDLAAAVAARDPAVLEARPQGLGNVTVQGLPALERLLFGEDAAERLAAGDAEAGYRAALLRTIGGNLATLARDILAGWTTDENPYATTLTGPRQPYAAPREAAQELFKLLHSTVGSVAARKLERPLGSDATAARPALLEWWRSGLSGQAIQANLVLARDMASAGFVPVIEKAGDGELAELLRRAFEQVVTTARGLPLPLKTAITDPARRAPVIRLQREATVLQALLAQRLPPALDIQPGVAAPDSN